MINIQIYPFNDVRLIILTFVLCQRASTDPINLSSSALLPNNSPISVPSRTSQKTNSCNKQTFKNLQSVLWALRSLYKAYWSVAITKIHQLSSLSGILKAVRSLMRAHDNISTYFWFDICCSLIGTSRKRKNNILTG